MLSVFVFDILSSETSIEILHRWACHPLFEEWLSSYQGQVFLFQRLLPAIASNSLPFDSFCGFLCHAPESNIKVRNDHSRMQAYVSEDPLGLLALKHFKDSMIIKMPEVFSNIVKSLELLPVVDLQDQKNVTLDYGHDYLPQRSTYGTDKQLSTLLNRTLKPKKLCLKNVGLDFNFSLLNVPTIAYLSEDCLHYCPNVILGLSDHISIELAFSRPRNLEHVKILLELFISKRPVPSFDDPKPFEPDPECSSLIAYGMRSLDFEKRISFVYLLRKLFGSFFVGFVCDSFAESMCDRMSLEMLCELVYKGSNKLSWPSHMPKCLLRYLELSDAALKVTSFDCYDAVLDHITQIEVFGLRFDQFTNKGHFSFLLGKESLDMCIHDIDLYWFHESFQKDNCLIELVQRVPMLTLKLCIDCSRHDQPIPKNLDLFLKEVTPYCSSLAFDFGIFSSYGFYYKTVSESMKYVDFEYLSLNNHFD